MCCYVCVSLFLFVFFCKQKTAYEMRISDWSSDVCSSDLASAIGIMPRSSGRRITLSDQPVGDLQHLFAVQDRLRVDFVCPHGGDHIDHLLHDLDVENRKRVV